MFGRQDEFQPDAVNSNNRIEELERRLAEAEAALYAIASGQIDAIITPEGVSLQALGDVQPTQAAAVNHIAAALEAKVAERTRELEQANAALQTEIQERRRAEQELKASQRKMADILESITEAYFAVDYDFRFLEVNPVAERIVFGRPVSELLGKKFWEVYPQGIGTEFYRQYHLAVEKGVDVHFEAHSQIVDCWFETHAYPRNGRLEVYFRDITKRKRAEERLAYQALLLDNVHDAIIATDLNFLITTWNRAAEELFGWTAEEALGVRAGELLRTEITDTQRKEILRSLAEVGHYRIELLHYTKAGEPVVVETTSMPMRDSEGQITGYVTASRDITARKQVEKELRQAHAELDRRVQERTRELAELNEELRLEIVERRRAEAALRESGGLLQQILDNLPVGVWVTDRTGRIIQGNPAGQNIWSGARYVGIEQYEQYKAWRLDTGKPVKKEEWAAARAVTKGETIQGEELEIECFDGTRKIILNWAIPLRDTGGEIAGAIVVNQDITQRKRVEQNLRTALEALRESEERLRTVVNRAPLILWSIDLEGNLKLLEGKELRTTGLNPDELVGTSIYDSIAEREEVQAYLGRALSGEEVVAVPVPSGDGHLVFETHYLPYYASDGQIAGVIGVSINITERLRAEEALREANTALEKVNEELEARVKERTNQLGQAIERLGMAYERLEQINRDLEYELAERERTEAALHSYAIQLELTNRDLQDFASIASHDMQEPLRKIQAFGDRLRIKASARLSEEERDYLERMIAASARMSAMVHDLLAYSRVGTRARPQPQVDLSQLAAEVVSDLEVSISASGGRVEIGELPVIEADPVQMRQLLQNLIGNGVKFHQPGVPPLVKVYARKPAAETPAPWMRGGEQERIEIVVQDNGIGFDEKYLDRIFQPFQRLVGRSEYDGSGIGLAICRKIVERHNGTITATSAPYEGTQFVVNLPVRQTRSPG